MYDSLPLLFTCKFIPRTRPALATDVYPRFTWPCAGSTACYSCSIINGYALRRWAKRRKRQKAKGKDIHCDLQRAKYDRWLSVSLSVFALSFAFRLLRAFSRTRQDHLATRKLSRGYVFTKRFSRRGNLRILRNGRDGTERGGR